MGSSGKSGVAHLLELVSEGAMGAHFPNSVPKALQELNEAENDAFAKQFHDKFGQASVANVTKMLRELGF